MNGVHVLCIYECMPKCYNSAQANFQIDIMWRIHDVMPASALASGRRGRDRMVVGFTTIYAISAYHH